MKGVSNSNNLTIVNNDKLTTEDRVKDFLSTITAKKKYLFLKTNGLKNTFNNQCVIDIDILEQEDTYTKFLNKIEMESPEIVIFEYEITNDFIKNSIVTESIKNISVLYSTIKFYMIIKGCTKLREEISL